MAQYNLLQIIQTAQQELGLAATTQVVGSADQTTIQMFAYANQEINELRQVHDWTALQTEYNLIVNPPTSTTGDLTVNSAVITNIPSTAGITAGYFMVSGTGIPAAARVLSVDSLTQVTMTMEYTGTAGVTGADLLFMQDTYPEPSDFDHFINRTWWDRTNRWELLGPDSPQLDQWHRSGIVTTGPRRHWRQLGAPNSTDLSVAYNNYRIWPPPGSDVTSPIQLVFEYISNAPVYVTGTSTRAKYFTDDTDIPALNDRAIIMGIKWRFWEQKGFDWEMKRSDYDDYVQRLIARDGGAQTLSLTPRTAPLFISGSNVQDGFFPGPIGPNMS